MKFPVILAAATLLGACTPLSIYHKTGASVGRMDSDLVNCKVTALRQVPVNTQTRIIPPIVHPGRRVCPTATTCHYVGGYVTPGRVETYDANLGLRREVVGQCMNTQGYAKVSVPRCPDSVAQSVPAKATRILPPITAKSCAIKNKSGSYQIIEKP